MTQASNRRVMQTGPAAFPAHCNQPALQVYLLQSSKMTPKCICCRSATAVFNPQTLSSTPYRILFLFITTSSHAPSVFLLSSLAILPPPFLMHLSSILCILPSSVFHDSHCILPPNFGHVFSRTLDHPSGRTLQSNSFSAAMPHHIAVHRLRLFFFFHTVATLLRQWILPKPSHVRHTGMITQQQRVNPKIQKAVKEMKKESLNGCWKKVAARMCP